METDRKNRLDWLEGYAGTLGASNPKRSSPECRIPSNRAVEHLALRNALNLTPSLHSRSVSIGNRITSHRPATLAFQRLNEARPASTDARSVI